LGVAVSVVAGAIATEAKQRRTACSGSFWRCKFTGATLRREIAGSRFAWDANL
jgi:hypothetical protein